MKVLSKTLVLNVKSPYPFYVTANCSPIQYLLLESELMKGYKAAELNSEESSKSDRSTWQQCQAVADMKFTYVVSCQQYGIHKRSGHSHAKDILRLMTTYVLQFLVLI